MGSAALLGLPVRPHRLQQQAFAQPPIGHADPFARPGPLDRLQDRGPRQHQIGPVRPDTGLRRPAEVAVLQAMGCRYGQGYLFARPMPADQLETWMQEDRAR